MGHKSASHKDNMLVFFVPQKESLWEEWQQLITNHTKTG